MLNKLFEFLCSWDPQLKSEDMSVVAMSSTGMVYLIFHADSEYPKYVIKLGSKKNIDTLFTNMSMLHESFKGHIAKPLHKQQIGLDQHLLIQQGLKGTPWMQISQSITSPADGYHLFNQAISLLNQFHASIKTHACWQKEIDLGQELRLIYSDCLDHGIVDAEISRFVDVNTPPLAQQGHYESHPQHGDFCINNLIFDGHHISVIDYDEFAMTWFPYFDELMLAFSFHELLFSRWNIPVDQLIAQALTEGRYDHLPSNTDCHKGIILYYLLFRLKQAHLLSRDEVKADLQKSINAFVNDHKIFLRMH